MNSNIKKRNNQLIRLINKEKRRKKARIRLAAFGITSMVVISGMYLTFFKQHNAKADTAQLLSEEKYDKDETLYSVKNSKFTEKLQAYKKVKIDSEAYESINQNSKRLFPISNGEYVKFYGEENGIAKVEKNGIVGYVSLDVLEDTKENELKVINGILLDSKKYIFPEDFETVFDRETENSMLVMFEAMRREGLNIGVSRKNINKEEIVQDKDQLYEVPDYSNNTLRTGYSIELEIPKTSNEIDFSKTKQGQWLKNHSYEYGFILRYPEGKENITGFFANQRIFRYVGVENAKKMHNQDLVFEEYFK